MSTQELPPSGWLFGHTHLPALHELPPLQALPQVPQFARSVCVLTQLLPHFVSDPLQLSLQLFCEQTWPFAHALPHVPQLFPSDARSTQLAPQAVRDAGHAHVPELQV